MNDEAFQLRSSRTLDGINRSPNALTTESTYRLCYGNPEVYITCIFRWVEWPIASYISKKAIELGKRLGKNTLVVPVDGQEEQFWTDAKRLIQVIAAKTCDGLDLDDNKVYLLISGCHPQSLLDANHPFLLCDVSELNPTEFIAFFSKLLDLFNVELESNFIPFGGRQKTRHTPGWELLNSTLYQNDNNCGIDEALRVLSEITFVLDKLKIHFIGYHWPIHDKYRASLDHINTNPDMKARLVQVKEHISNLNQTEKKPVTSIMFLAADPTDASRIRLGKEFREIEEQLSLAKYRRHFKLELPQLSIRTKDITRALLNIQPQIVHFSGHGTPKGALCFEDETGQTSLVQPDALAALFEQFANQVDCILLNTCYSETQARAIARHVNYVIGMNDAIDDEAAIAFSLGFYQALGAGRTIEDAFNLGCVQVHLHEGNLEYLAPVLIQKGECNDD